MLTNLCWDTLDVRKGIAMDDLERKIDHSIDQLLDKLFIAQSIHPWINYQSIKLINKDLL